jgi:hypothetical protein
MKDETNMRETASKIIPCIAAKTNLPDTAHLSDEQLLKLCQRYGEQSRVWRQKFAGLLPEVNKRRLYEKKGFTSIFEFALKLAGMSDNQVCRILNLERNFADKPALHRMLINGEVSPNKLIKIAPIATAQNQEALAAQVKILPCRALETFARDEKFLENRLRRMENDSGEIANFGRADMDSRSVGDGYPGGINFEHQNGQSGGQNFEHQNGLKEPINGAEFAHVSMVAQPDSHYVNNDIELVAALKKEVKEKLVELKRKGIDINYLILEMIAKRDSRIQEEKLAAAATVGSAETPNAKGTVGHSRYIPANIKRIIRLEHGQKCSIPNCSKPVAQIHHAQRFALNPVHDPRYMAPLCAEHHKIAHAADIKYIKWSRRHD